MRRPGRFHVLLALPLVLWACGPPSSSSFSLSWKLVDASQMDPVTAPPLSCGDAGIGTIRLTMQAKSDPAQPITADFPCAAGNAVTAPVRAGAYTFQALALTTAGPSASQLSFDDDNTSGDKDLGEIIFQISRTGH